MESKKLIFTLCVRSWWDGSNSYYSMRIVHPDGFSEILTKFSYGRNYVPDAVEALTPLYPTVTDWHLYGGQVRFVVDETEVSRRKHLHGQGR